MRPPVIAEILVLSDERIVPMSVAPAGSFSWGGRDINIKKMERLGAIVPALTTLHHLSSIQYTFALFLLQF
jgi:hypothetical protein